jgi:hypothetical protein
VLFQFNLALHSFSREWLHLYSELNATLNDCSVQVLFNDILESLFYVITGMVTCLPEVDPPRFKPPPHYHVIAPKIL